MIGEKLGAFAIEEKLGQGGMGAVFAARSSTGEKCALKLLSPELSGDEKARARFRHECRVLRELEHPRIVRALSELVEEGERCFYAMELVEGEDLGRRVERQGALPARDAVAITSDVLEALAAAHGRGILHRDVKPSNVFVSADGRAKLGDFGIAFVAGATRHTRTGTTLGTPEFMAPEVAKGGEPTERTDLYATGVLLYLLLEGRPPFTASQPLAVLKMQTDDPPPPLSARVSTQLAACVARALAKDPAARFTDARSFREALLAAPTIAEAETAVTSIARAETRPVASVATPPPPSPPPRKRKTSWVLLFLGLVLLAGIANHSTGPAPPPRTLVSVQLRGGDKIEGELVKLDVEADVLIVRLANGSEQRLPLADVASYEKRPR